MPRTALRHFNEDIARAKAMVTHAESLADTTVSEKRLRADVLRSAWMLAVGALDAYFCDAYSDLVAATASSKSRQPTIALPRWAHEIKFPLGAILESYSNANWRWRMAARRMMERENVVSLPAVQTLFNKFFRKGHRFFGDRLDAWMSHAEGNVRLFAISPPGYRAKPSKEKRTAREAALDQFEERFRTIFQRRHDCIHNCDRPRRSPQPLDKPSIVKKVIQDIEFLVHRCDEHINAEFRHFLTAAGCTPATITQAGY